MFKIKQRIARLFNENKPQVDSIDNKYSDLIFLVERFVDRGLISSQEFNFESYSRSVLSFTKSMKTADLFNYRYSHFVETPTIYGSIYACLIYFLLGKQDAFSFEDRRKWSKYFDSFQREDGLFIDPVLESSNYYNLDWWGARHLSLHIIICYNYLGVLPRYEFNYIKKFYDKNILKEYIDGLQFENLKGTDSDNAIMNLGSLLQYQRDFFNDKKAGEALDFLFVELEQRVKPETGSWGSGSNDDKVYLSRAQQFAYHLYPLWLYDGRDIKHKEKLIDLTLNLQNVFGGFGVRLNSSACEDIDGIDLLIKLSHLTAYRKEDIKKAIKKALVWVLSNQNDDGGFVFKLNEPFVYGHPLTSSLKNESHLFATWFRTLSIAYLTDYLGIENNFNIGRCPGLHFNMEEK